MFCIKCKVHICCHAKRNCFIRFYTEAKKVIHLPTLFHSDSDEETYVDEPETVSAPSESESLGLSF